MKILHAAETIQGGVATVLSQIVSDQRSCAKVDSVMCLVPDDQASQIGRDADAKLFTFRRTGRNVGSLIRFLSVFLKVYWVERPDVVHLHSTFAGFIGRFAVFFLRPILPVKVVFCPHAFAFLMATSRYRKSLYGLIERLLQVVTDRIICVSDDEATKAAAYGISSRRISVIRNGTPPKDRTRWMESEDNEGEGPVKLLFVGRLDYQKGFDVLIQAMEKLDSDRFHLTVVGSSVLEANSFPSLPNIDYVGWVGAGDIFKYYLSSDVLVMPSRWEGFAMVPIEAMSYGLAVCASDYGSIREVICSGDEGFLFPVGDSQALVTILDSHDRSEWRRLGLNGLDRYRNNFTSDKMLSLTRMVYRDLGFPL